MFLIFFLLFLITPCLTVAFNFARSESQLKNKQKKQTVENIGFTFESMVQLYLCWTGGRQNLFGLKTFCSAKSICMCAGVCSCNHKDLQTRTVIYICKCFYVKVSATKKMADFQNTLLSLAKQSNHNFSWFISKFDRCGHCKVCSSLICFYYVGYKGRWIWGQNIHMQLSEA